MNTFVFYCKMSAVRTRFARKTEKYGVKPMALISAHGISLSFSERVVFSDVSFDIYKKDKIGFIGVNGAGKTTLFKLLTRQLDPDSGDIFINRDSSLGYMEQHACSGSERTLFDELLTVFDDVITAEKELDEIAEKLSGDFSADSGLIERQQYLLELFERRGGLTYKSRARSALLGLGFEESDFSLPCSLLSGGQRSKVSLAKLLLSKADLLLLDEPTNHLDIESIGWLEAWLSEYSGTFVVISHDRYFLDKVTNRTFELENGKFYCTNGNYSRYHELKAERRKNAERVYDSTMKEVKRIQGIIEQQKTFSQERNYITIASKQKSIDRLLDGLEKPERELDSIHFSFKTNIVSGNEVLSCENLSKAFESKELFSGVSMLIERAERVFITGENGCGKSTLLKMILGKLRRDSGKIILGANVRIGYFDQTLAEISNNKTVLDEVWDDFRSMPETQVRNALAAFLFKGDDVYKITSSLSGGEKARLALLKLMLSGANFLILDEPTNHLDIKSREALEASFDSFDGTMLVVSHDRYFINRLATRILRLHRGGVDSYPGNYDNYLEHRIDRTIQTEREKPAPKENTYKIQKELESLKRRTKGRISRLEEQIDALDAELSGIQNEISSPENAADYEKILTLTDKLGKATEKQEQLMLKWQTLIEELEKLESGM